MYFFHVNIAFDQNTIENLDGRLFEYLVNSVPGLAELPPFTTEPSLNQFYVYDTLAELVDELAERDFTKWVNTHNIETNDTMKQDRRVSFTTFASVTAALANSTEETENTE